MLKPVVEQVKLWAELFLGCEPRRETAFAHEDGHSHPSGKEHGLVSEFGGAPIGVDQPDPSRLAAISTGQDVERYAAGLEMFSQQNGEGRLARASRGEVAYAHYRSAQVVHRQPGAVVEMVASGSDCTVDGGKGVQERWVAACEAWDVGRSFSRAASVFPVAPVCDRKVSRAFLPNVFRAVSSAINSMKTNGNSAGPT